MHVDFVYMLFILLMPLIPAFVLFRFLPSSAGVQGPLKGLNIKLGGAFAGYIVAVLLSWQVASSLLRPTWFDKWNLIAQLKFDGVVADHPSPSEAFVMVRPPTANIDSSGLLQMTVALPMFHTSALEMPSLVVTHDGYETESVTLDPDGKHLATYGGDDYKVTFDEKKHEIVIGKTIIMTKAPQ